MQKSESIKELAKALAKAQLKMGAASKSSLNPHFKSKFAGLPEVVEVAKALNKHGLAYVQPTHSEAASVTVETVLMHGESGEWISGELTLRPQQDTPQGIGSAITYGRRYGLCALVGIVADEDDDGNAASQKAPIKSNGNGKPAAPSTPTPQEQEALRLEEACVAGFPSLDDKLKWKTTHRETINAFEKELKQRVVAAFDKAEVRQ
jgi:hypothetical protein